MHPGDHLHQAAVAILQPLPVESLHLADVGAAVLGQPDALLTADEAGHGERPDPLVTQMTHHMVMDVTQLLHQAVEGVGGRGDELQQALRVVGSDIGMGQGRAQRSGMVTLGESAIRRDAQTFTLDPAPDPLESSQSLGRSQRSQQLGE